jgi:hypothetical protein
MRFKIVLFGLGVSCLMAAGTMLAQTTATAPASKPATAASAPATTRSAVSSPATATTATTSATSATSPATAASAIKACLKCHPWDKVIAASAAYKTPEGDKVDPHIYVPHDSKTEADIPDCLKCHTKHAVSPLPKKGEIDLKKVSVKWCYDACHHEKNFEKCDKCH